MYNYYMEHRFFVVRVLVVIIGLFLFVIIINHTEKRPLKTTISILDVGQGDSALIQDISGKKILIDGGKDASVLQELSLHIPASDRFIDVVIVTHPDMDHAGGIAHVLHHYDVGIFLTSQVFSDTKIMDSIFKILSQKNIPSYFARRGMTIKLNTEERFIVLFPDRDTSTWKTNEASIIGRFEHNSRSMLFMGDAPKSIELYLSETIPDLLTADILKIGHHGSNTSSDPLFIDVVTPYIAFVSAGKNNQYGHPTKEIIDIFNKRQIPLFSTITTGTIHATVEDNRWQIIP